MIYCDLQGIYNKVINWSYTTTGAKGKALGMSIGNIQNYTYAYDIYGRLNQITTPAGNFNYTRVTDSNLIAQMSRPNGVTTTYTYEPHRDLITEVNNGGISIFGYTNNSIGNRTSMSRSGTAFAAPDTISYTFNDRSEVTDASSNVDSTYNYAFGFDPIGNRLTGNLAGITYAYTSNSLNQYTAVNTEQPTYDADGNMLTRNSWMQVWNGENRLVETSRGDTRLTFDYDYMGRRIEKKVFEGEAIVKDIRFVYNGYKLVEELNALNANVSLRHYTWQPNVLGFDFPLCNMEGQDQNIFYHIDANKNVTELIDSEGKKIVHYEYSPFGHITQQSDIFDFSFSFSSEYYDKETSLIYYNYRYYSPEQGKWISRDPIGERGGINIFSFVRNNPLNWWDSKGLDSCAEAQFIMAFQKYKMMKKEKARNTFPQVQKEANCILDALLGLLESVKNDPQIRAQEPSLDDDLDFLKKAAEYYKENYSTPDAWNPTGYTNDGYGLNLMGCKPAISGDRILEGPMNTLDTLIHEPQHDLGQMGIGHDKTIGNRSVDFGSVITNMLGHLRGYASRQKKDGCCEKTKTKINNLMDEIICNCKE